MKLKIPAFAKNKWVWIGAAGIGGLALFLMTRGSGEGAVDTSALSPSMVFGTGYGVGQTFTEGGNGGSSDVEIPGLTDLASSIEQLAALQLATIDAGVEVDLKGLATQKDIAGIQADLGKKLAEYTAQTTGLTQTTNLFSDALTNKNLIKRTGGVSFDVTGLGTSNVSASYNYLPKAVPQGNVNRIPQQMASQQSFMPTGGSRQADPGR